MQTYELTAAEQREHQAIHDRIEAHGGLYAVDAVGNLLHDAAGAPVPLDYVILRSRRYLVDARGVLWRFFAEGSPKHADGRGAPWRNSRVEMWTGRWRKTVGPDGKAAFAKQLVARPIDKRINGHPGMSNIDWYLNIKGYKHPLDGPDAPPEKTAATDKPAPAPAGPRQTAAAPAGNAPAGHTPAAAAPSHQPNSSGKRTNKHGYRQKHH